MNNRGPGETVKKSVELWFNDGPDGLPIPKSMLLCEDSFLERLWRVDSLVFASAVRLWARQSNVDSKHAVWMGVLRARRSLQLPVKTDEVIARQAGERRALHELPLLTVMGMVSPGCHFLRSGNGHVIFPYESVGLNGVSRRYPFGVIKTGEGLNTQLHLFVDIWMIRGATPGLNNLLNSFAGKTPKFHLFVHVLYWGVAPRFHLNMQKRWPLLMSPSILAYWRTDRGRRLPEYVEWMSPISDKWNAVTWLKKPKNWAGWLVNCGQVQDTIDTLSLDLAYASVLPQVPQAHEQKQRKLKLEKRFRLMTPQEYQARTGVPIYGERGWTLRAIFPGGKTREIPIPKEAFYQSPPLTPANQIAPVAPPTLNATPTTPFRAATPITDVFDPGDPIASLTEYQLQHIEFLRRCGALSPKGPYC